MVNNNDDNGNLEKFVSTRLNYFLIATSFLILSFVTVSGFSFNSGFVQLIAAIGSFISLWFLLVQFFAAKQLDRATTKKEKRMLKKYTYNIRLFFTDMGQLIINPFKYINKHNTTHIWIFPFCFCFFWFFAWWRALESIIWPSLFYGTVIVLVVYYEYLTYKLKRCYLIIGLVLNIIGIVLLFVFLNNYYSYEIIVCIAFALVLVVGAMLWLVERVR